MLEMVIVTPPGNISIKHPAYTDARDYREKQNLVQLALEHTQQTTGVQQAKGPGNVARTTTLGMITESQHSNRDRRKRTLSIRLSISNHYPQFLKVKYEEKRN